MDYIVKAYKDWKLHSQFQEIVPDMDDEFMFNEKQSIRESARSLKKYGSTCCNHIRNNETLIRHNVEKTDTLQGIALKYGCTTEQIRRANRLFASDSLFLRLFLLIPVEKNSPYYPTQNGDGNLNGGDTVPSHNQTPISDYNIADMVHTTIPTPLTTSVTATDLKAIANLANSSNSPRSSNNLPQRPYSIAGELLIQTSDDDPAVLNSHHNSNCSSSSSNGSSSGCGSGGSSSSSSQSSGGGASTSKSLDSVVAMSPEEESRKCINDFLNKIDTTISESKKYVEKSREMLTTRSDDDLFVMNTEIVERRRNNLLNSSYKNNNGSSNPNNNNNNDSRHQRHSSNGSGNSDTAQLLNTTQLRRVQNSLKRLEKQQDDFFEL